jgi:hypothetical protein
MDITLTPAERKLLLSLLERALSDLRIEVRHTRTTAFRGSLHDEEKTLVGLLDRLRDREVDEG